MSIWTGLTIPPATVLNSTASAASVRQLALAAERRVVPLTYGEDRVAGLVRNVLPAAAGSKTLLVQVIWGWGCDAISELLQGDAALPTGSTATHYTGSQAAADPQLVAAMAAQGITYSVNLQGYAYSVIAIPIKLFDGQLNFTAKIRGRRVYDPRQDSTAGGSGPQRLLQPETWTYSATPALAMADWTASRSYGAGLAVDWASVATLANLNEALVGGEPRRLIGLTLRDAAEIRAVAETLRAYAGCWALPTASGVRFLADADAPAAASYSHAAGDILAMSALELRDTSTAPTAVEVIYTDTSSIPWRDASAFAELPGAGVTLPWRLSQVRLPGIQRYSQALREATERLNKLTLADMSTSVDVPDIGIRHEKADIVQLTLPMGIVAKPFRVQDVSMPRRGTWRLTVQEHDPAVYSDLVQTAPSIPDTSLNNPAGPPDQVLGLAAEVVVGALRITRTPSTELDIDYTAFEYSTDGGAAWLPIRDPSDRNGCVWSSPPLGEVRLRARDVDTQGQPGAWSSVVVVTVTAAALAPTSSTLGIKINANDFAGTLNWSEAYIHGIAGGVAVDAAGSVLVNGVARSVPAGVVYTNRGPADAWIVWDMAGVFDFSPLGVGATRPYAMARRAESGWQYDNNGTDWVAFTPGTNHVVIGSISTGGPDVNAAPGITSATMFSSALSMGAIPLDSSALVNSALQPSIDAASAAASAAQGTANTAASNATSALSALATMRSNGYIDASEKPALIKEWQAVDGERAGIYASATAYGLTTQRDAYQAAYQGVFDHLVSLSPSWADTTTDTPITPAVDQAVWANYYAQRQTVLNAIAAEAGRRAEWTNVGNRPRAFKVTAWGLSCTRPANAELRNAETNDVWVAGGTMYRVATIHRITLAVTDYGAFNTLAGTSNSAAMAAVLNAISGDYIVVVWTYDEPQGNRMASGLAEAMYRHGASPAVFGSPRFRFRSAYILVGLAGCGEGNGAEVYAGEVDNDANAWCELTFSIQNGALVVSGNTSGARALADYGYTGALDATRNYTYRQDSDPGGLDGDTWLQTSTGRAYQKVGGSWQPYVAPGSVNTAELADGAVLDVLSFEINGPVTAWPSQVTLQRANIPAYSVNTKLVCTASLTFELNPSGTRCWGQAYFNSFVGGVGPAYNTASNTTAFDSNESLTISSTFDAYAAQASWVDLVALGQGGLDAASVKGIRFTILVRKR